MRLNDPDIQRVGDLTDQVVLNQLAVIEHLKTLTREQKRTQNMIIGSFWLAMAVVGLVVFFH